jgi:hypothetical protein
VGVLFCLQIQFFFSFPIAFCFYYALRRGECQFVSQIQMKHANKNDFSSNQQNDVKGNQASTISIKFSSKDFDVKFYIVINS